MKGQVLFVLCCLAALMFSVGAKQPNIHDEIESLQRMQDAIITKLVVVIRISMCESIHSQELEACVLDGWEVSHCVIRAADARQECLDGEIERYDGEIQELAEQADYPWPRTRVDP